METRLDHLLATAQSHHRLPSVVAALVRGRAIRWQGYAGSLDGRGGPAPTADTQYRIGSISKTLVAVAVLRARDAGLLDLDDRLDQHVDQTSLGGVTVLQLLSHAAGVQAEGSGSWWERTPGIDFAELSATVTGRLPAGRRFHYSNVGFALLGELLTRIHGRPWHETIATEILTPLGMHDTTLRPRQPHAPGLAVHPFADLLHPEPEHDAGAMAPAGQYWCTIGDLARWGAFLAGDTAGVLAADTLTEMQQPLSWSDAPGQPWTSAHGLGLQLWNPDGTRLVGHGGSMPGFVALVRARPGQGAVVAMTNSTNGALHQLATDLMDTLDELDPCTPQPWVAGGGSDAEAALELLGQWFWGPAPIGVSWREGLLMLGEPGVGRSSRFRPTGDTDRWIGLDGYYAGEPLQVHRRADGSVSHLDLATFRFTRTPYDPHADLPGGAGEWH